MIFHKYSETCLTDVLFDRESESDHCYKNNINRVSVTIVTKTKTAIFEFHSPSTVVTVSRATDIQIGRSWR